MSTEILSLSNIDMQQLWRRPTSVDPYKHWRVAKLSWKIHGHNNEKEQLVHSCVLGLCQVTISKLLTAA